MDFKKNKLDEQFLDLSNNYKPTVECSDCTELFMTAEEAKFDVDFTSSFSEHTMT